VFPLRDDVRLRRAPLVVLVLVALCVLVFLRELQLLHLSGVKSWRDLEGSATLLDALLARAALIPEKVARAVLAPGDLGPVEAGKIVVAPFFTSLFLHAGWGHLLANLWFLWVFGKSVEDRIGRGRFLVLYFGCGLVAGIGHVAFLALDNDVAAYAARWALPMRSFADRLAIVANEPAFRSAGIEIFAPSRVPTIGASGAIAGVLGTYLFLFPRARVASFVPPFFFLEIPALVFLGAWLLTQAFGLWSQLEGPVFRGIGGIAYGAHFAGFAAGFAVAPLLRRRDPTPPRVQIEIR